jgi:hypothetical protein
MAYNEQASLDESSRMMTALLAANKRIMELEHALNIIASFNSPDPDMTTEQERDAIIAMAQNALR